MKICRRPLDPLCGSRAAMIAPGTPAKRRAALLPHPPQWMALEQKGSPPTMKLSNLLARLWSDNGWQIAVEQTATQAVDTVCSKLSQDILRMNSSERYGYVRAHATATVLRLAQQAVSRGLVARSCRGQSFEHAVLEAVVGMALVRVARSTPAATTRRAA